MKQLRKTEWQKGFPIKKNLALCAWGLMALAGFFGNTVAPKEYSIADSVCSCIGNRSPITATPVQIL